MSDENRDLGKADAINESEAVEAAENDIEDISEEIKEKPKKKKSKEKEKKPEQEAQDTSVQQFRGGKKKKGLRTLIIVLIVLAIVGFIVYRVIDASKKLKDALGNDNTTTAEIQRMDLSKAISTTGTIQSKDVRTITSRLSGVKIDEVSVEVGDMVKQGDVIVTFSREDINKKIGQLEEDITEAKQVKNLDSGDRTNTYVNGYDNQTYAVATAYEKLQNAGDLLQRAKDDLAKICTEKGDYRRANEYRKDDENYRDTYNATIKSYEDKEVTAQRAIDDAQRTYDLQVVNYNKAAYDASFNDAKSDYTKSKGDLQANDNIKNLERQKEQNEDSLDDYIVTAPISGLVTAVNAQEGNGYQATTGALMTIQAVDVFEVTTQVDEYDINNVKVGQKVAIMTDATGDYEYEGRVTFIAPTATTSQSSGGGASSSTNTFEVKIDITNKDDRLRLGMSAKLNILVDTHDNVLVVPYDAIEQKDGGQNVIYVVDPNAGPAVDKKDDKNILGIQVIGTDGLIKNGSNEPDGPDGAAPEFPVDKSQAKEIPVKIGLEGDYYTEVISDQINEGMTVLVNSKAGELQQDMSLMGM